MPRLLWLLKVPQRNIKLIILIIGICSLFYTFKDTLVDQFTRIEKTNNFLDEQENLHQKDKDLINYVRNNLLSHPKYFKREPETDITEGQHKQAHFVDQYLNKKTSGFFVEAGAWDGVYLSNSLFFEKMRNWTGILVEPNIEAYKNLTEKSGRSVTTWCLNACLSTVPFPQKVQFNAADVFSGIANRDESPSDDLKNLRESLPASMRKAYQMQCLPVYSIVAAATNSDHPEIDYFSLDVEGAELAILQTIPWESITIRTLSIEVQHSDAKAIEDLMTKNGYQVIQRIGKVDIIFAKT